MTTSYGSPHTCAGTSTSTATTASNHPTPPGDAGPSTTLTSPTSKTGEQSRLAFVECYAIPQGHSLKFAYVQLSRQVLAMD